MAQLEAINAAFTTMTLGGQEHRIYFEQAGDGIPLVCLHTAGSHSSQWRHIMNDSAVTDHFSVMAFDLPWHGKSDPPVGWQDTEYQLSSDDYVEAIMAFVDHFELKQPVIMGCSMGGRVVIRLAIEFGDRLGGVVGLEASDHPSPWYDDSWLERPEFARGDFCAALVSGLAAPTSPEHYRWETLWHYYQGGPDVFKGDMHFYRTDSQFSGRSHEIDTTRCPVFLMTGEYDYSCQPHNTNVTAERIAGAEAIIMKDMGHFPMSENPQAFRRYLLPVLERLRAHHGQ